MLVEAEQVRREQAARVFFLRHEMGLGLIEACAQVGITRNQYYQWIHKATDAIEALRHIAMNLHAEEYVRILDARGPILGKVIEDGESPMTDPLTRLAILQHLEVRGETLQEKLTPVDSEGLNKVLGMPVLRKGESRIVGGVQLNIEELEGGGVNITAHPPLVIDGELDEI
jgi:transposase-like protein